MTLAQAPIALRAAVRSAIGEFGGSLQQAKLTASDGAALDQLGSSVALSGSTALVGAVGKNMSTGAAYVFTRSGTAWTLQAKLTPSDAAAVENFGFSVAISGSTALVGAYGKASFTGAAYVFVGSGTGWTQQAKLTASDGSAGDRFGSSVAISGSTALVGAFYANSGTGSAYVFVSSGTAWTQQARLTASDGVAGDYFGFSVAISGSTAAMGAYGKASFTGATYVFSGSGTTWTQQAKLTASDGAAGDRFGFSVAISGSTAVVGAFYSNSGAGASYMFAGSGATWTQQAKLTAQDGAPGDYFGMSVAISGSGVAVGAYGKASFSGAVYAFLGAGTTWTQQAKLTAFDGVANDGLGYAVAISGSTALTGAFARNSFTGAAYVYALPSQQAKLTASDGAISDGFGWSVAVSGTTAVVGAPYKNSNTGTAYVFVGGGPTWTQQAELTASDRAQGDYFGFAVAISGSTLVVGAEGKTSLTGATYVFVRSGTVWAQQSTLTASDGAPGDRFGSSLAISGSTAVVGAPGKTSSTGGAYVFAGSGATWTQQAELTASDGHANDQFGYSLAISGFIAVIGAIGRNSNTGAAYAFALSGTTWAQQAELTASDGAVNDDLGWSVAISGSTAMAGAPQKSLGVGAAYLFGVSGTTWSQQAKLKASDGMAGDLFGYSVAISGTNGIAGSPYKNSGTGSAYVLVGLGTTSIQQAEVTASDGAVNDNFGWSVAVSGTTAVAGASGKGAATGAAYVYM